MTSQMMWRTSVAMGRAGVRSLARPTRAGEPVGVQALDSAVPGVVCVVESFERRSRCAGVVEGRVVDGRTAEVVADAHAEHTDDDVAEPPCDGRQRRWVRFRVGEIRS